jgi:hypothetical protein
LQEPCQFISPILKADTVTLHVSREKDKEIALVDAGWDDTKVGHPNGCGQARRTSQRGSYPLAGGSDDPPSKTRTPPPTPLVFHQLQVPLTCIEPCIFRPRFFDPPLCVTAPLRYA